jgi:hypothetical protein
MPPCFDKYGDIYPGIKNYCQKLCEGLNFPDGNDMIDASSFVPGIVAKEGFRYAE